MLLKLHPLHEIQIIVLLLWRLIFSQTNLCLLIVSSKKFLENMP